MTEGQPATHFRYWAFISYSHRDKSWGRWLHKALETYRVPKHLQGKPIAAGTIPSRLTPIFRDRDELPTASDLGTAIEEALRQSWCLIVICSPESAKSRWVNEEVLAFQRMGRSARIHCLIVDSGNESAAPLIYPPALIEQSQAEGHRNCEPIAADARRFGDGPSNARLKLIAGILGIGYDTLFQREQQRRHRNLFNATCASLALVAVLAVSTIVALTSRRDAVNQRGHAERLVEFMISDLRKKLEPDGKLATLDAVGKEALAYYAAQKSENLDATALARRARALHMIGEVYDLRGELDEALDVFKQAAESTAELLHREPANGQRIFDHAQSVYWVGYIAYQRGDAGAAEQAFLDYKRLADQLVASDPHNDDWQAEAGYANSNLGTLLYDLGRFDEASDVFSRELEMAAQLTDRAPTNVAAMMRNAQAHAWLADVLRAQGRFDDAALHRRGEMRIYNDSLELNSNNTDAKEALLVSEHHLAVLHLLRGDLAAALAQIRSAAAHSVALNRLDPENARWTEATAAISATLAEALIYAGDLPAAYEAARRANEFSEKLVQRDSSVVSWQLKWIASRLAQARLSAASGDTVSAMRQAQSVMAKLDNLPADRLRKWERTRAQLRTWWLIADIYRASNQPEKSGDAWLKIVEIAARSEAPRDPGIQSILALALQALGRSNEARPIQDWLAQIGFREPGYRFGLESMQAVMQSQSIVEIEKATQRN